MVSSFADSIHSFVRMAAFPCDALLADGVTAVVGGADLKHPGSGPVLHDTPQQNREDDLDMCFAQKPMDHDSLHLLR